MSRLALASLHDPFLSLTLCYPVPVGLVFGHPLQWWHVADWFPIHPNLPSPKRTAIRETGSGIFRGSNSASAEGAVRVLIAHFVHQSAVNVGEPAMNSALTDSALGGVNPLWLQRSVFRRLNQARREFADTPIEA